MGDPKKGRKKFDTPKKMWDKAGVEKRRELTELYGLKNKKEIWKAETALRKKRQTARKLLALPAEVRKKREKELLDSMVRLGALKKNPSLDDVLSLKTEALLDRRLQSIVWRQGLTATAKQARQLITHGHIAVRGRKVSTPGYLVKKSEEASIGFVDPGMGVKVKKMFQPKEKRQKKWISAEEEKKEGMEKKEEGKPAVAKTKEEKPGKKKEEAQAKGEKPAEEKKEESLKEGKKEKAPKEKKPVKKPGKTGKRESAKEGAEKVEKTSGKEKEKSAKEEAAGKEEKEKDVKGEKKVEAEKEGEGK